MVSTSSPGFQIETVLCNLQRLARVARDGDLFCDRSRTRQPACGAPLSMLRSMRPRVIHRRLVDHVAVALERLVNRARAGTAVAVVQVADRAIERERFLDFAPVSSSCAIIVRAAPATAAPAASTSAEAIADRRRAILDGCRHARRRRGESVRRFIARILRRRASGAPARKPTRRPARRSACRSAGSRASPASRRGSGSASRSPARACIAAANLNEWLGTTRSSWSAVVTSVAG